MNLRQSSDDFDAAFEQQPQPVISYGAELNAGEVLPFHHHRRAQLVYAIRGVITVATRQAAFVIPMAVSLAFGVGCTTIIVLVLVPAGYLVLEDIRGFLLGARDDEDEGEARITVETPEGSLT